MPVLKRRNRIVIFRLTDDEYEGLKVACTTQGARNLSDFARSALLRSVAEQNGDDHVTARLAEIESGMRRLEQLIQEGRH